jgi:transposase
MSIPGGPIKAQAIAASVQDASSFEGPREFAAFLGLTPRQGSSGGKQKLGRISARDRCTATEVKGDKELMRRQAN